jgi:hypothetical protein
MYRDRVKDTTISTGTGAIVLAGAAPTGFQTFAAGFGGSATVAYCIADQTGANWEVGTGVFDGTTGLTRVTVLGSSAGGSLVNFSAGTKDVFCTAPAAYLDSFTSTEQGVVPASGGGTNNFLRADGQFTVPPGTVTTPGAPTTSVQYNDSGAFAGNANFTYNVGTNTLTTGNITGSGPAVGLLAPPLTIQPRVPTVAEVGGALNLFTPNAVRSNSAAGQVNLVGGNGLGTGAGGNSVLRGGNGGVDGSGGSVNLNGGSGNGTGNGGSFSAVGGAANASGNGGICSFISGSSIGSGNGGDIRFRAGTSTSGNGGSIEFVTQFSGGPGIPKIFMSMGGGSDGVNDVPGEFEVYSDLSATTIFKCSVDIVSYTGTVGFFGVTPAVQQDTSIATIARTAVGGGNAVDDNDTFGGYTIGQIVTALKAYGLLT